jgi:hypothetical protein
MISNGITDRLGHTNGNQGERRKTNKTKPKNKKSYDECKLII